jgi:hypothetical protein
VIVDYIDAHRDRFGVAPICRVLAEHGTLIAPSNYLPDGGCAPSQRGWRPNR